MEKTVIHHIAVTPDKDEIAKTILHHIEATIRCTSLNQLQAIVETLKTKVIDSEQKALAQKVAGKNYSEGNLALLELANLERNYQRRRELLKSSITSNQVTKLIGCKSINIVDDRRKANIFLAIKDHGSYKFPLWQFDPEGNDGVVNRLPELLNVLDISDYAKLSWLTKPLKSFENMTPVQILKCGDSQDIDDLITEARGVGVAQ